MISFIIIILIYVRIMRNLTWKYQLLITTALLYKKRTK